jgi:hypothetical protein
MSAIIKTNGGQGPVEGPPAIVPSGQEGPTVTKTVARIALNTGCAVIREGSKATADERCGPDPTRDAAIDTCTHGTQERIQQKVEDCIDSRDSLVNRIYQRFKPQQ